MLDGLVNDASLVYLLLGIAALGLAAGWWITRRRSYAIGLGIVAGLFALVLLLSLLIDTDQKKIDRKLQEMAAAVKEKNTDKIFAHISDQFRLGQRGKGDFRSFVESYLKRGGVRELNIWDVRPRDISRAKGTAIVTFKAKGKGNDLLQGYDFYNVKAVFGLDPDGEWRMRTFDLFAPHIDPMINKEALPLSF